MEVDDFKEPCLLVAMHTYVAVSITRVLEITNVLYTVLDREELKTLNILPSFCKVDMLYSVFIPLLKVLIQVILGRGNP